MIFFSCIVPIYNIPAEKIKRCIESIEHQTFNDFEIIVVDDGSNTETRDFCDSFKKENIRVIHKQNGGLSSARNIGIEAANGKWIVHIDGDDWVEDSLLANIYSNIDNDIDVLIYGFVSVEGEKRVEHRLKNKSIFSKDYSLIRDDLLGATMRSNTVFDNLALNTTWGKAFRTDFLKVVRKFDERLRRAQDAVYNLDVFWKAHKVTYVDKCLYYYEIDNDTASRKYNPATVERMTLAAQACVDYIKKKTDDSYLVKYSYGFSRSCFGSILESIIFNPTSKEKLRERRKMYMNLLKKQPYKDSFKFKNLIHIRLQDDMEDLLISFRFFYLLKVYRTFRKWLSKSFR